jgi:Lrp/AsnC family leucine-responsive transcriptional regulator
MSEKAEKEFHSVDEIGWIILDELQKNGRSSFKHLAEKVKLSPTAVIERVKRMEEEGIITGYGAIIDPRKVGYSLSAIINLSANPGSEQIINESLSRIPEVLSCWSLTGTNDFMLEIQVPSLEFLEELLTELARHGKLTTSIVLPSSEKRRIIHAPRMSMTD